MHHARGCDVGRKVRLDPGNECMLKSTSLGRWRLGASQWRFGEMGQYAFAGPVTHAGTRASFCFYASGMGGTHGAEAVEPGNPCSGRLCR